MNIHPTAVVADGVKLGKDVTIGAFSYIDNDVEIGDGCVINSHVTILPYTSLGKGCRVHAGAVLGDLPQDLAYKDEQSFVKIGENCVIREGVTIHRGTKLGTVTSVGNNCLLMAFSHVAHNVQVGNRVIIANGALLAGYVQVGDQAFISGNCLVHQFTRVGRLAMLSGGCAVHKDVLPFCTTRSVSLNKIMGLNVVGMQRAGLSSEERLTLKRAFKVLYQSKLTLPKAVARLEEEFDSPLVTEVCEFIKSSQRGICTYISKRQNES
ncbi:MAG TPA: acyl-ACP--UDP-N-acetylglucosamine O-acyltransferase [Oculatellaceae cyanobacterium]|jgi:UDP-N-acetylglucosamine acyltransferase